MKRIVALMFVAVVFLVSLFWYDYAVFNDGKLHMVFCDVGQGDAILIKTPNSKIILVDGGPDKKILNCLSDHLPFWHRNIDLMILTHPHLDHFFGMYYVIDRYSIDAFATEELMNETDSFKGLLEKLSKHKIPQKKIFANDKFRIGEVVLEIESPTADYIYETSPGGQIGEHAEFASLITRVTYGDYSALLTGDSQEQGVLRAKGEEIDVLQIPHHGSKTGMSHEVIDEFKPKMAIISVGKKNRYGHPNKMVIDLLAEYKIATKRTDQSGAIELVSDGKRFWLTSNK